MTVNNGLILVPLLLVAVSTAHTHVLASAPSGSELSCGGLCGGSAGRTAGCLRPWGSTTRQAGALQTLSFRCAVSARCGRWLQFIDPDSC